MRKTTLCYICDGDRYLMLHRVKKKNDANKDKWIGVGGGFEQGETADMCLLREVYEETGLTLTSFTARGIVDFASDEFEDEQMYLYTGEAWTGSLIECNEGVLEWVEKSRIPELRTWEGDRIFLNLIASGAPWFRLRLEYKGEALARAILNGTEMELKK